MSTEMIQAIATGYLWAMRDMEENPNDLDTWMVVGDYHINLCGNYFAEDAPDGGLVVYAYPATWEDELPDPVMTLIVNPVGEDK